LKTERVVPYGPTGAGAPPLNPQVPLHATPAVGLKVPATICALSGKDAAAASSKLRPTEVTSNPDPTPDIKTTFWPRGPTSKTSMSSGYVCVIPVSVTFTSRIVPFRPEIAIGDGYGVAAPNNGIVIAAVLEKTVAAAGPAVHATNPTARMSELHTPTIPLRLALIPWRMCVNLPLDRLL
jgi:hypothetical protein